MCIFVVALAFEATPPGPADASDEFTKVLTWEDHIVREATFATFPQLSNETVTPRLAASLSEFEHKMLLRRRSLLTPSFSHRWNQSTLK